MKKSLLSLVLLGLALGAIAQVNPYSNYVNPYTRQNGTTVQRAPSHQPKFHEPG